MGNYLFGNKQNISKSAEMYTQKMKEGLDSNTSPKEMIEIFLSLQKIDYYSKFSIQVQISDDDEMINLDNNSKFNKSFLNLGLTNQKLTTNGNIDFENSFVFPYYFEKEQIIRFKIIKEGVNSNMVVVDTIVGKLMGSRSQRLIINLGELGPIQGDFIIQANTVKNNNILSKLKFSVTFDNSYKEPFFYIRRDIYSNVGVSFNTNNFKGEDDFKYDHKNWLNVYKSEVLPYNKNTNTYTFNEITIHTQILCNGNLSKPFLIEFYDYYYKKSLGHALVFLDRFTYNNSLKINLYNDMRQILTSEITLKCNLVKEYKFLEYLRGGLQISLIIGIDFTASNGDPLTTKSLHYIGGVSPNPYERAISSCGEIVAYYDADQLFPVYGYGAILQGLNTVHHCFNVNFQFDPNVQTIDGVIHAYRNSVRNIKLYGPTFFTPLIKKAIEHCHNQRNDHVYFILMILTDGIINDMPQTIDALVEASYLPISVIIVGVGNADFANMDILDADDSPLISSTGVKAARDLVQFVPFGKFENDGKRLAAEVLEEIPRQIEEYFRLNNIPPRDPIM